MPVCLCTPCGLKLSELALQRSAGCSSDPAVVVQVPVPAAGIGAIMSLLFPL